MEVLNLLGNSFEERSLAALGGALIENSNLIILKIGAIKSNRNAFASFLNNGFMTSKKLRYLYITTPHFADPTLKELNASYLPKVIHAT